MTEDDTAVLAQRAVEQLVGTPRGAPRRIAAGMSCEAFAVETGAAESRRWVVRVPVPGTDRSIRFHAEAALGGALARRGHRVARWRVVEVDGVACAVGDRLLGSPVEYGDRWTPAFCARFGDLLADLHALPATGFGPLVDDPTAWRGERGSVLEGVRARWDRAVCWPFDDSDLADHPVVSAVPASVPSIAARRTELLAAAEARIGVVHSDLHREHLLVGPDGELTGVLDFGDAFVGSAGWDFAALHWYYGAAISAEVARHHPHGSEVDAIGRSLALPLGLYKLAKAPEDPQVQSRLGRLLGAG